MKIELLIKVAFACMACDGEIDATEINCIKQVFEKLDSTKLETVSQLINDFRDQLNADNKKFFNSLFTELKKTTLTESEEIELIVIAIKIIESDDVVDYSEVKLLKKIRSYLKISDQTLLNAMPDKEDYIASDINNNVGFFDNFSSSISIKEIEL